MENRVSKGLVKFLNTSHSHFHAVENIKNQLKENGFCEVCEGEKWTLEKGKNYFVTRNDSSIIAFRIPQGEYVGFNIVASHSDSPCFKIKENSEVQGRMTDELYRIRREQERTQERERRQQERMKNRERDDSR